MAAMLAAILGGKLHILFFCIKVHHLVQKDQHLILAAKLQQNTKQNLVQKDQHLILVAMLATV